MKTKLTIDEYIHKAYAKLDGTPISEELGDEEYEWGLEAFNRAYNQILTEWDWNFIKPIPITVDSENRIDLTGIIEVRSITKVNGETIEFDRTKKGYLHLKENFSNTNVLLNGSILYEYALDDVNLEVDFTYKNLLIILVALELAILNPAYQNLVAERQSEYSEQLELAKRKDGWIKKPTHNLNNTHTIKFNTL